MATSFRSGCPIASTLDLLGDRWSLVIVRSMVMGARSYGDFLKAPERIATNVLAERLARLEAAGVIRRTQAPSGRTRGAYELTARGGALIPALQALSRWGEAHLPDRWRAPPAFYAARPEDFG